MTQEQAKRLDQAIAKYNEVAADTMYWWDVQAKIGFENITNTEAVEAAIEVIERMIADLTKSEEQQLQEAGCTEITTFKLINNYGFKFRKGGFQHTLTHYKMDNGKEVNYWTIWNKIFTTFEDALDFIKQL